MVVRLNIMNTYEGMEVNFQSFLTSSVARRTDVLLALVTSPSGQDPLTCNGIWNWLGTKTCLDDLEYRKITFPWGT